MKCRDCIYMEPIGENSMYDLMDDIENPLEPTKVKSALLSEYQKMEYRKTHRPKDINILDYTVIAALEKQMPKKPDYEGDGYADGELVYDTWICPCCGKHYEIDYDDYDYCPNCGQHILWEVEDER